MMAMNVRFGKLYVGAPRIDVVAPRPKLKLAYDTRNGNDMSFTHWALDDRGGGTPKALLLNIGEDGFTRVVGSAPVARNENFGGLPYVINRLRAKGAQG